MYILIMFRAFYSLVHDLQLLSIDVDNSGQITLEELKNGLEKVDANLKDSEISGLMQAQQYREQNFKKYSELISYLLVAEQNNELLMKNHESRPTGSTPFLEVNATIVDNHNYSCSRDHNRSNRRGRDHNQSRGRGRDRGRSNVWHPFARLLAQIIRLRAQFPDYAIKTIRLDNPGEFTSQALNDYCMSIGINVEHPVAHDVSNIREVSDHQEVFVDPSRDESLIFEILELKEEVGDDGSASWFLQDLASEQESEGCVIVYGFILKGLSNLFHINREVVAELKAAGATWIQFDEPTLVKDLDSHQLQAFTRAYSELESSLSGLNVIIESYFADVPAEAYKTLTSLKGVAGYGFDLVNETKLDAEIKSWLAFAAQKVVEVNALAKALSGHKDEAFFAANAAAQASRKSSPRVTNEHVQKSAAALKGSDLRRATNVSVRLDAQQKKLSLPVLPTTTIGSFPQTMDLRRVRREYKAKKISEENYVSAIKEEINKVIKLQEELDIDILLNFSFVNQRNDMVEYFGEQLSGFAFTVNGWVQSYGSCCVKPPIIYGDVSRPKAMTVFWSSLAQSLTKRPMKGMLTGPVTILNWSFVRNDQPRSVTCYQIALAIKDEVEDLEKAVVCMTSTHQGSHLQKKSLTGSIRCLLSWRLTFCKCRSF
ncbi:5-methyltetrahydropteroyltriglutamate--homocysteine methyltransferase 1-like [Cannabis sativa]|nr:5-methyltetrahydropteroyltriglutamate--homocysteine methyltransferase 1-like [Cannabis sativa]